MMALSLFLNILLLTIAFCGPRWSHSASVYVNSPEQGTGLFWQITDIHWDTRYSLDGDPTNMCHDPLVPTPKAPIKETTSSGLSHGIHLSSHTEDDSVLREDGLFMEIKAQMEKNSHSTKNQQPRQHTVASPIQSNARVTQHAVASPIHARVTHEDLRQKRDGQIVLSSDGDPGAAKALQLEQSNGKFGNYLCDAPWQLVKTTLDAMVTLNSEPDFILWTGDMAPHVQDPAPHFSVIFSTLANVTRELRSRFPASVAVLPVLGNHDSFPKDDYPDCPKEFYEGYLKEGGWELVLDANQQEAFSKGGFYSHLTASGLTVAVLNTNLYYMGNKRGSGDPDPCGQLAWLAKLLQTARAASSKVLLTAHSPAGYFERMPIIPFFNDTYNERYLDLMAEYGDVIHSHVYGHLHTDTFRLYDGGIGKVGSVGFLAPSVTPWQASRLYGGTAINPSLRLYSYDTISIVDYTQYHLNLTRANQFDQMGSVNHPSSPSQPVGLVKETVDTTTKSFDDVANVVSDPVPLDAGVSSGGTEAIVDGAGTDKSVVSFTTEVGDIWSRGRDLKAVASNVEDGSSEEGDCHTAADTPVDHERCMNHKPNLRSLQAVPLSSLSLEATASSIASEELIPDQIPNLNNLKSVQWVVFYEARKAYSLDRLDAANMEALYKRLESDKNLFNVYFARNSAGMDSNDCNSTCRQGQLCSIRYSKVGDLLRCVRYSKTYFAELLGRTFSRYSPSEYDKYFQDDSVQPGEGVLTSEQENADVDTVKGVGSHERVPTTLRTPESSFTNSLPMDEDDLRGVAGEDSTESERGYGVSALVFLSCVASVWLVLGVLYATVKLKRYKNRGRSGLIGGRTGEAHVGYTPLYGNDD